MKYRNASTGATGGDFLIRIEANGKTFDGNSLYRFVVPPGNTEQTSGGFTLGLVGIERGTEVSVTATIDWALWRRVLTSRRFRLSSPRSRAR